MFFPPASSMVFLVCMSDMRKEMCLVAGGEVVFRFVSDLGLCVDVHADTSGPTAISLYSTRARLSTYVCGRGSPGGGPGLCVCHKSVLHEHVPSCGRHLRHMVARPHTCGGRLSTDVPPSSNPGVGLSVV